MRGRRHPPLRDEAVVHLDVRTARASDASSRSIIVTGSPASSAATAMPAPIVPPPTTPIRSTGRALARAPRRLRRFALREERMHEARALRAVDALQEQAALELHPRIERLRERGLDGVDDLRGREQATRFLRQLGTRRIDRACAARGQPRARAAHRCAERQLLRIREAFGERVVARDAVDEAQRERFVRAHMTARQHQVERGLRTNQAAALRAARAGQQAERDFGQPELRARHREPVMRGERDFEAAAERRAVQRDHDRLRARFDPLAYIRQRRRRDRLAELADVGARDEVAAGADDQHRPDRVVGLRGVERVGEAAPHLGGQRVDGRMVDRDDEHLVAPFARDGAGRAGGEAGEFIVSP